MLENNILDAKILLLNPSKEMEQLFITRSNLHRSLVKQNLLLMEGYLDLSMNTLTEIAAQHDLSKYKDPERIAYMWMTWKYYCKNNGTVFNYPAEVDKVVIKGWLHHIQNNDHHPEAHQSLDAMSNINIVEMVCDWAAIAQENNHKDSSCLAWAKMNIDKEWQFSLAKKDLIFATIRELDYRRGNI